MAQASHHLLASPARLLLSTLRAERARNLAEIASRLHLYPAHVRRNAKRNALQSAIGTLRHADAVATAARAEAAASPCELRAQALEHRVAVTDANLGGRFAHAEWLKREAMRLEALADDRAQLADVRRAA